MNEISNPSPFDAIRRVDDRGEYWLARELAPPMEYGRWNEFAAVVEKAKASLALVEGQEMAEHHFVIQQTDGGRWGNQSLDDCRLTRFAAYLVAMAGDDTKPAVARARIYFAVKTREAEVRTELDELEMARRYVLALEAKRALEAKVAVLEPDAAAWNHLASGVKDWDVADCAKFLSNDPSIKLGRDRLFERMREMGWVYRAGDDRWRAKQSEVDLERLAEMPQRRRNRQSGERVRAAPQVRITPKGLRELHRRLGGTGPFYVIQQLAFDDAA